MMLHLQQDVWFSQMKSTTTIQVLMRTKELNWLGMQGLHSPDGLFIYMKVEVQYMALPIYRGQYQIPVLVVSQEEQ